MRSGSQPRWRRIEFAAIGRDRATRSPRPVRYNSRREACAAVGAVRRTATEGRRSSAGAAPHIGRARHAPLRSVSPSLTRSRSSVPARSRRRAPSSPSRSSAARAPPSRSRSFHSTARARGRWGSRRRRRRPDAHRPVPAGRRRGHRPAAGARRRGPGGDWRARGADAVVVGSMRRARDGRVEVRFALVDTVKQTQLAAMTYIVAPAQFRATAHKIADVDLREAHRRPRRVLDAHRLHRQAGPPLPAVRRRGRRLQPADGRDVQRAAALAGWSPDGTRIAYVSLENKKPVVYVQSLATGAPAGARQFPRQQQRAGVVARRPQAGGHADQGRRLADLPDQPRRHRRAAHDHLAQHRHRGQLHARRRLAAVHLRSRRHAADLPAQPSPAAPSSG